MLTSSVYSVLMTSLVDSLSIYVQFNLGLIPNAGSNAYRRNHDRGSPIKPGLLSSRVGLPFSHMFSPQTSHIFFTHHQSYVFL